MNRYLIDIRLMGPVKHQINNLSDQISEKYKIGNKLVVPHISLAGPFSTDDEKRLIEDFTRICAGQTVAPKYEIGGYGFFDKTRVIFVTIRPDENLKQYRWQVAQTIAPYCTLRPYDLDNAEEFRFHSTLAMKLDWLTYHRIKWYFRDQEHVSHVPHPVRVTLLRNSRIVCEYDFVQGRMLTGAQARSKATRMRDFDMLKAWADGSRE
jgi:hypothetical protein